MRDSGRRKFEEKAELARPDDEPIGGGNRKAASGEGSGMVHGETRLSFPRASVALKNLELFDCFALFSVDSDHLGR
jgi:hypothetical protein